MTNDARFQDVFAHLKGMLERFAAQLVIQTDAPGHYALGTRYNERWKKELSFGSVQIRKRYVSYYFMPVYMFPELLDGISPELRQRMQGKGCFNFTGVDELVLSELARLTAQGCERFEREQYA